jgi:hypothetical protein
MRPPILLSPTDFFDLPKPNQVTTQSVTSEGRAA